MHIRRTVGTGSKLIALFAGAVPEPLVKALVAKRLQLSPELAKNFNEHGRTSHEVFGDSANEAFMAWN